MCAQGSRLEASSSSRLWMLKLLSEVEEDEVTDTVLLGGAGGGAAEGAGAGSATLEDSCLGCLGASTSGICWIRLAGSLAGFLAGSLATASVAGEVCSVSASWPKLGSVGRKLEVET